MAITIKPDSWLKRLDINTNRDVEFFLDYFERTPPPENTIRIILIQEPTGELIGDVMAYPDCYDHVLTYHQEILDNNPKAIKFIGTQTWINPLMYRGKVFAVSNVVGGKLRSDFPGYALRFELWDRRHEIKIPKLFYVSSQTRHPYADYNVERVLGDTKEALFDAMFHIAIENTYIANCMSEKIIDCFLSYTIPIYFGTPNLNEYFNMDGVFMCRTVSDIISVCNQLTPELYESKREVMKENYERALKISSFYTSITNTLNKILQI